MRSRFARALVALLSVPAAVAAQAGNAPPDLTELDIEELGRITVTSASRGPEPVSHASAAIFVITREDMRRAGSRTIPDALRLAPGLQVARVTARDWSITARGFAEASPNKLLVLVDEHRRADRRAGALRLRARRVERAARVRDVLRSRSLALRGRYRCRR